MCCEIQEKYVFEANWNSRKIKEMSVRRTSIWGSTKNTFCVFKKKPKSFFVTFEPLSAKKTKIFRFFSSFSLFIFGRPPAAGMGGPLTPNHLMNSKVLVFQFMFVQSKNRTYLLMIIIQYAKNVYTGISLKILIPPS